jgi:hypothetical protein
MKESDFKEKYNTKEALEHLMEDFASREELREAVAAFEDGATGDKIAPANIGDYTLRGYGKNSEKEVQIYSYTGLKGPKGVPIFTSFMEGGIPVTPLAGDVPKGKEYVFLLNAQAPYPEIYKKEHEGSASMGLVHFFGVPVARKFNAASLTAKDADMIERMMADATKRIQDRVFRAELVERTKLELEKKMNDPKFSKLDSESEKKEYLEKFKREAEAFLDARYIKLNFYFHVNPFQSVGHLHMHCIPEGFETSTLHNWKNMPAELVVDYLKEHRKEEGRGGPAAANGSQGGGRRRSRRKSRRARRSTLKLRRRGRRSTR